MYKAPDQTKSWKCEAYIVETITSVSQLEGYISRYEVENAIGRN